MLDLNRISQPLPPLMGAATAPTQASSAVSASENDIKPSVSTALDQLKMGLGQAGSALTNIDVIDESGLVVALSDIGAQITQVVDELQEIKQMLDTLDQLAVKLNEGGLTKETVAQILAQLAQVQAVAAKFGIEIQVNKHTDANGQTTYDFVMARNNSHYSGQDPQQIKAFLTDLAREFLRESIKREGYLQIKEQWLSKLENHPDVQKNPQQQQVIQEMKQRLERSNTLGNENRDAFRHVARHSGYTEAQIDAMIQQTEAEAMLALVREVGQQQQIQAVVNEASPNHAIVGSQSETSAPLVVLSESHAPLLEEPNLSGDRHYQHQQQAEEQQIQGELQYLLDLYDQQRYQENKLHQRQEAERYQRDRQQAEAYKQTFQP